MVTYILLKSLYGFQFYYMFKLILQSATDKKVKKGKRYYYKVKALRGSNGKSGIAYSAYTAPKRSGKVK